MLKETTNMHPGVHLICYLKENVAVKKCKIKLLLTSYYQQFYMSIDNSPYLF